MELPGEWSEGTWRIAIFAAVFASLALLEIALPRRGRRFPRQARWLTNFAIVVIDSLALRLLFPIMAVGTAQWAAIEGVGLLNSTALPGLVAAIIGFVVLDVAIYGQHVASHKIPLLWRLHQVHHADPDFDVTTAIRFHPVEIILSMLWKMVVVVAFGVPAIAVFVFEVVLNGAAVFNHANLRLPSWLDRVLRLLIVTPDMHRVHHSVIRRETDSNYGFNLSIWDRLFGTYRDQPELGHQEMAIGLPAYRDDKPTGLGWSLWLPFRRNGDQ